MTPKKRIFRNILLGASPPAPVRCYVSYSPRDGHHYAEELKSWLKAQGFSTFSDSSDTEMDPSLFATRLDEILRRADVCIVIWTPAASSSPWVEREVLYFLEVRRAPILAIVPRGLVDQTRIPQVLDRTTRILIEDHDALYAGPTDQTLVLISDWIVRNVHFLPETQAQRSSSVSQDKLPLNEGKLILVGRGEVGKTSLVRRLAENDFREDELKTQGIKITNWSLLCDSELLRLNIWDFGGQEIMHATHQFFLTERSLYLLVLNGREGGEDVDAEYWLKHIESFGADSPVIVVQNKIGQHPFELNYRGLRARYPQIYGFVKTDCKERIGLHELRQLIRTLVVRMPEVRMLFPVGWLNVKERLESMENDFLGYDGFRELCREEGVEDDADRDTLCWLLHCLGIALNYRDDSRLRETTVLKPEWVTQGIYKILNAKELAERQGELNLTDLQTILPNKQYPHVKHFFLLELMRKFSLCFPFPDATDRYLVPELLGKEEPKEAGDFSPGDCLNFEYEYGVLPEGLIPRFIVRSTH